MLVYEANSNERMAPLDVLKKNHILPILQVFKLVFNKEENETWEKLK